MHADFWKNFCLFGLLDAVFANDAGSSADIRFLHIFVFRAINDYHRRKQSRGRV